MTNKEVYDIVVEGDADKIKNVLPGHYLAKGDKFILPEGKPKHGSGFDVVGGTAELDKWYIRNYKSSGRHSDDLTMILIPNAPNVRLEIKDRRIFKALWMFSPGLFVDITHNIHFFDGVPLGRMPSDNGYIHGAIVSDLPEKELYNLVISAIPDVRILACKFVVMYAHFIPIMFDKVHGMFDALKHLGFDLAAIIETTIPKWDRAVESAKVLAGSGNVGYNCSTILTAYSDIKMIDLFSSTSINKWGVITSIAPTSLFEVVGLSWDTVIDDNRVNIIPVVSIKYGNYAMQKIDDPNIIVDNVNKVFYVKKVGFKIKDIDSFYCVGDIVDYDGSALTTRFSSKNTPMVTPSCPKCGHGVDINDGKIYCVNNKCPAVVSHHIKAWIDKFCPDTDMHLIEDFLSKYEVANIGDIYTVSDSGDKFDPEHSPIYYGVVNSREAPNDFLHILMPFLTQEECNKIMMSFWLLSADTESNIKHIFSPSTLARLEFNEETIDKILTFLDTNRIAFVNTMSRYHSLPRHPSYHKLYKRTFFIDGLLYYKDKVRCERIINSHLGRVISNFAPYIDGFIYGEYADRAIINAVQELATHRDVAIYSEEEFNKLVGQADGGM